MPESWGDLLLGSCTWWLCICEGGAECLLTFCDFSTNVLYLTFPIEEYSQGFLLPQVVMHSVQNCWISYWKINLERWVCFLYNPSLKQSAFNELTKHFTETTGKTMKRFYGKRNDSLFLIHFRYNIGALTFSLIDITVPGCFLVNKIGSIYIYKITNFYTYKIYIWNWIIYYKLLFTIFIAIDL